MPHDFDDRLGPKLQVRLLGPTDVLFAGVAVAPAGAKRRAFLALLALGGGEIITTDQLVSGLWGEDPPRSAANLVHTYVALWRQILDRYLGAGNGRARIARLGGGYRLDLRDDELDVTVFRRLATRGGRALGRGDADEAADAFEAALGLWHGDPLADLVDVAFRPAAAAQLAGERRRVLLDWASAAIATGRADAVAGRLRDALDRNPLDEPLAELLMRVMYQLGRHSDALAVFEVTRRALAEDLGADPGPPLSSLHLQVLRHDATLGHHVSTGPGRPLPVVTDRFIGRDREVAEVTSFLADHRLVTVIGAAGSGKTRLALEVATLLANRDGHDVRFVDASVLSGPRELLARVSAELEVSAVEPEAPREALRAALAARRVLLVLDNLEHLPTAGEDATWLLSAGRRVRLLATSRRPLMVAGERRYPLAPLEVSPPVPGDDHLGRPRHGSADELFVDRACAVDPAFPRDEVSLSVVREICRRLDGLPLAVELAVGWLAVLPLDALSEQLAGGPDLLLGPGEASPDRHRTLRAALDGSYSLLDDEGRRLLRTLSIFRGGCHLDAIVDVLGAGPADTLHLLRDLVDRSLLVSRPTPAGPRFSLLETVRAYAAERLAEAGEEDGCRDRHGEHYLSLAERAGDGLAGAGQVAALDVLDVDQDNVATAIEWIAGRASGPDRAVLAAARLWRFWHLRSRLEDGRIQLDALLALRGPELQPGTRAAALMSLGSLHYWRLGYARALECYDEAVDLCRESGDARGLAEALCDAAYAQIALGHHDDARVRTDEAYGLYVGVGDERGRATAVSLLALLQHTSGRPGPAIELAERALADLRRVGDEFGAANARALLGTVLRAAGRYSESEEVHRLAIREQQRLGNTSGIAWCLAELAAIANAIGDPRHALVLAAASDAMSSDRYPRIPFPILALPDVRATTSLDPELALAAWTAGRALTEDEAIRLAARDDDGGP